ncbi:hypothetical protein OXPF_26830 [Oxobacter pfennigii]|uniref:Uncharacterized protein n=1 Tax=Oxobacter pfennigii TaxID=36849 RepID=A0A0P8W5C2_9CLOT|nr:hypothetical protein [Oxobacter pfennigii]KPU43823.1 hypothetical protein OXPF_26830 [Oxobacter pfennigii]
MKTPEGSLQGAEAPGEISAQIVFYQYILNDGESAAGFRDTSESIKIGFDKIEDMFR